MVRPRKQLVLLGVVVLASFASTLPSGAATSNSVVSANVLASTSLSSSCHDREAWSFGTILPGSGAHTSTGADVCRFTWSSSNSSSALRIHQSDREGTAMVGQTPGHTRLGPQAPATRWFDGRGSVYLGANEFSDGPMSHSTDTGQNFADLPQAGHYRSVSMVDPATAWRAGASGVQISTDANTASPSWTDTLTQPPAGGGDISYVDALSASTAWVIKYDNVYLTTDGGATWVAAVSTPISGPVEAASASVAFGTGWAGALSRTTDGNLSWAPAMTGITPHAGDGTPDVSVAPGTPTTVWFLNSTGVYRSIDSGASWTATTALPDALRPASLTAVSASEAYAGGDDGIIFHTADSGLNWTRFRTPIAGPVSSIVALSGDDVLVAERNGPSFVTRDGGDTWSAAVDAQGGIQDMAAIDRRTMVVSDVHGRVRVTTDHGSTWTTRTTTVSPWPVRGVSMQGSGDADGTEAILAVGDLGRISRSLDGGATWKGVTSGTGSDLWDVDLGANGIALAVGADGTILRSSDWGMTWTSVGAAASTLRMVDVHDDGTAIAVGHGGLIRHSTDGGLTWTTRTSGVPTNLLAVSRPSDEVVYVSGEGKLVKSTNGGLAWTTVTSADALRTTTVVAPTDSTVWLFGKAWTGWDSQWAMRSLDGGATFAAGFPAHSPIASSALAFDTGRILFGGLGGEMRMTDPAPQLDDYAPGAWDAGLAAFGVCLQDVGGAATASSLTEDADAACTLDDGAGGDSWYAVQTAPTKVGQLADAGTGSVDLVWGMRAAGNQAPGDYAAGITVTVVAPNV